MCIAKKITGILTAMVCAAGIFAGSYSSLIAEAEYYIGLENNGELWYDKVDEDGDGTSDFVAIANCSKSLTELEVPSEIDGIPVKVIGDMAFYDCTSLTSLTIPDSIIEIGYGAFIGTTWLEEKKEENPMVITNGILIDGSTLTGDIVIPDTVKIIGNGAFIDNANLTSVTIPDSVISIGDSAFNNCANLASVTLSNSITSIIRWTFYGCTSLTNISIPEGVTYIDLEAFNNCTSLSSITIPETVTSIGRRAFGACKSLESITIENPDCIIEDSVETIWNYMTYDKKTDILYYHYEGVIYGMENSTAQTYAEKYDINFGVIDEDAPAIIPGDISGNGKIDLYDAIEICKSLMGMRTFTDEEKAIADYDGNGKVDLYDAIGIAKKLLEK